MEFLIGTGLMRDWMASRSQYAFSSNLPARFMEKNGKFGIPKAKTAIGKMIAADCAADLEIRGA
jgi:hypothetical protein